MTDNNRQPFRPPERSSNHYAGFKDIHRTITAPAPSRNEEPAKHKEFFSMNITASIREEHMNESELNEQFLIDLIFKPNEPGLRLRPAETQLLLAYIGEILKELESDEKLIEEEQATKTRDEVSCQNTD
jgi:hypothetical protein